MSKNKKRKPHKVQYKLWVHIEEWVDGEPVDGDIDLPVSVTIPWTNGENLIGSIEEATMARDKIVEALMEEERSSWRPG